MNLFLRVFVGVLLMMVGLGYTSPELRAWSQTPPVESGTLEPSLVLERLFVTPSLDPDWFASSFIEAVPLPRVQEVLTELKKKLGEYQKIERSGDNFRVHFAEGYVEAYLALDRNGKITGLRFDRPSLGALNPQEAVEKFKSLPGQVSFLLLKNGQEQGSWQADQPLAVGSAFKLAVLKALRLQIERGDRTWSDVVELRPEWQSIPTGMLQDWPARAPLTLYSLAALMISISDNTATDTLIHTLGREAIEPFAPHSRPFLTTREAFILKDPQQKERFTRYERGNERTRRQVIAELQNLPRPGVEIFGDGTKPIAINTVEWFFTARELCNLIEQVADLPLMGINPGSANPKDWERIAFKGGSEPGVINFTTHLKAKNGQTYCVAATWNNPNAAVEIPGFQAIYNGVLEGLK